MPPNSVVFRTLVIQRVCKREKKWSVYADHLLDFHKRQDDLCLTGWTLILDEQYWNLASTALSIHSSVFYPLSRRVSRGAKTFLSSAFPGGIIPEWFYKPGSVYNTYIEIQTYILYPAACLCLCPKPEKPDQGLGGVHKVSYTGSRSISTDLFTPSWMSSLPKIIQPDTQQQKNLISAAYPHGLL